MGMNHNRARFLKSDYSRPLERCWCAEGHIPTAENIDEEWLILEQDALPVYDEETQQAIPTYSKVDGIAKITYTVESL